MVDSINKKNVLVILTSHSSIDQIDETTGWYLPELAHPYYILKNHVNFTFASPKGGEAPIDLISKRVFGTSDKICAHFLLNEMHLTQHTTKLSDFTDHQLESFDAVFIPGGHGPMFDLATDSLAQKVITNLYESGKCVAVVSHGLASIVNAKLSNGEYMVKGKKLTGFTNNEEEIRQLTKVLPFSLETLLVGHGAAFSKRDNPWISYVVVDGNLITGQNPSSATAVGKKLLELLILETQHPSHPLRRVGMYRYKIKK